MSFLLGICFLIGGLVISIALHELGHLLPAKKFGTLVPEYMIGFGPSLWSKRVGETVYGIKLILLGGYCRILGMYGPPRKGQTVYRKNGEKLSTEQAAALSEPELMHYRPTLAQAARENSLAELPKGEEQRAFYLLPVWKKLVVMCGGPVMNLVLSLLLLAIAMIGIGINAPSTKLADVVCYQGTQSAPCAKLPEGTPSPAAQAGLQAGDKITAWNGTPIKSWEQLQTLASQTKGEASVTYQRGHKQQTVTLQGLKGKAGLVSQLEKRSASWSEYLHTTRELAVGTAGLVIKLPLAVWDVGKAMLGWEPRDQSGVMSIIGAGRVAGEISSIPGQVDFSARLAALISLLASLNMALFIFNLIPLPPLDGGHIVGALYQGVRSRIAKWRQQPWPGPVDAARAVPLTYLMASLLIGMTVLLVLADFIVPVSLSAPPS